MKQSILKWELIGIPVIIVAGALLHFVYGWSGKCILVGVFGAVNESVWEHFKLGFWPALVYSLIEFPFINKYAGNFIIARAAGIFLIPIVIAAIFYTYTTIIQQSILFVDIMSFTIAVALCQLASYKILTLKQFPSWLSILSIILLGLLLLVFIAITFYPPHILLFKDGPTGTYGIFEIP